MFFFSETSGQRYKKFWKDGKFCSNFLTFAALNLFIYYKPNKKTL